MRERRRGRHRGRLRQGGGGYGMVMEESGGGMATRLLEDGELLLDREARLGWGNREGWHCTEDRWKMDMIHSGRGGRRRSSVHAMRLPSCSSLLYSLPSPSPVRFLAFVPRGADALSVQSASVARAAGTVATLPARTRGNAAVGAEGVPVLGFAVRPAGQPRGKRLDCPLSRRRAHARGAAKPMRRAEACARRERRGTSTT